SVAYRRAQTASALLGRYLPRGRAWPCPAHRHSCDRCRAPAESHNARSIATATPSPRNWFLPPPSAPGSGPWHRRPCSSNSFSRPASRTTDDATRPFVPTRQNALAAPANSDVSLAFAASATASLLVTSGAASHDPVGNHPRLTSPPPASAQSPGNAPDNEPSRPAETQLHILDSKVGLALDALTRHPPTFDIVGKAAASADSSARRSRPPPLVATRHASLFKRP